MNSIINWEELGKLGRPAPPLKKENENSRENGWDKEAEFYNRMAKMETEGTLNQIGCLPITDEDTVIDAGCGPGRIVCQVAKIAKKVIAVDSSEKMMEKCKENIAIHNLKNVETIFLDWDKAEPDVNVPKADIIIASRSVGAGDIAKFRSFANKYAALICWANAPNLPTCAGKLFENAGGIDIHHYKGDRRLSYNLQYNMIYDMGYEPNVNIVKDGFGKNFETREQAYKELILLNRAHKEVNEDIFKANVDKYLTRKYDGTFDFWIETRSYVIWWETNPKKFD